MERQENVERGAAGGLLTRRSFGHLVAAAGIGGITLDAAAGEAPVPLENFFQNPSFGTPGLSPDGKSLAIGIAAKNGRTQLVVIDVAALTAKVVAGFSDADVWNYRWVNERRLVYQTVDRQIAPGERYYGPGLFAVDSDGGEFRQLVNRADDVVSYPSRIQRAGLNSWTQFAFTTFHKDSDDVFVYQGEPDAMWELHHLRLLRLNTRTGRSVEVRGPDKAIEWITDAADEPRVVMSHDESRYTVHYNDPVTRAWRVLRTFDVFADEGFRPHSIAADGTLFVTGRAPGADTEALFRYDLAANAVVPEPIVSLVGYDFAGTIVHVGDRIAAIRYTTDAVGTVWLDDKLKDVQRKVDALLPATANQIEIATRGSAPVVAVNAFSDRDPGTVYLYDIAAGSLQPLGKRMRDIDPRRMGRRELVRYKARDGLEIPAWLTLPPGGGKKLPMVVLVHGGPNVPGATWRWDADSQFLASRGYAVLEPDYRGTTGYGSRHFRAGWKQWGLKMQDDIADGTRWAIAQGIADPQRVCIAGASYGGYATLMGLVNDPDLYKCGINWVGVTDIEMMYTVSWSDFSRVWQEYGMPRLVGDRVKDAEQLKKTSPLQQASRIRQPLLMAYGGIDRRVPIVHGTRFRDAVEKVNPNVEWVEYRLEGHGWALVQNRIDWWTRVEKFLARHLAPPSA